MSAARTARERVRAELTREIKQVAREHLGKVGASTLSLRAVARDLGMASSAIYRYYPSRDDLLTVLIIDAYDAVGAAAEAADAAHVAHSPHDFAGRWLAICRAVRRWALDHPHEYALIYGSPVPGYRAPLATIGPASRVPMVLVALLEEAQGAGLLQPPPGGGPVPPAVTADLRQVIDKLERDRDLLTPDALARGMAAWIHLYGTVSFELFGQLNNVIEDRDEFFDFNMRCMATQMGLVVAGPT